MSFGLLYNGSVIRNMEFSNDAGVYCVAPSFLDDCPNATKHYKVGFTGTSTAGGTSGSLASRFGTYATSFVRFRIPFVITYSRKKLIDTEYSAQVSHNMAHAAEQELFAWMSKNGFPRREHVSGRPSEWFNVDRETLKAAFDYMTDLSTPGILYKKKPEPLGAWYFGENVDFTKSEMATRDITASTYNLDPYSVYTAPPQRDDRERRDLEKRIRDAELAKKEGNIKPKDRFLLRDLKAQYAALMDPTTRVEIEPIDEDQVFVSKFGDLYGTGTSKPPPLPVTTMDIESDSDFSVTIDTEDEYDDESIGLFTLFGGGGGTTRVKRAPPLKRFYNTRSKARQLRPRPDQNRVNPF